MKHLCAFAMAGMLIVLCVLLVTEPRDVSGRYENCINQAKAEEEKGLYINAIAKYTEALEIYDKDQTIKYQIVNDYKNMGNQENWLSAAELFVNNFPKDTDDETLVKVYDDMVEFYYENKDYENLIPLLKKLNEKKFLSDTEELKEKVNTYYEEIRGFFSVINCDASYLSDFYHGFAESIMETVTGQSLMMETGELYNKTPYEEIYLLDQEKGYSMVKEDGVYKVYTANGYLKDIDENGIEEAKVYNNSYIAGKKDGKFQMYTSSFQNANFGGWDDFHLAAPGTAVVRTGENCQLLIGNSILESDGERWEEIKYSERGVKENNHVFFAGKEGEYSLIEVDTENVSYEEILKGLEDAKAFNTEEPAAVKQDGKWGFLSVKGEMIIEPQYEDAGSFSYGYAPVKIDGKWTLIDIDGNQMMEPQFADMGAPTENGIVPVQYMSGKWNLISLFIKNYD